MNAWPGLLPTTLASRCCRTVEHRKRSSNWTRQGSCRQAIPPVSRFATSRTWCWAPCCSNQALLRAGWAEATAQQYDRALVPWNILVEREPTDAAVQEVMLAVPHAYASMKLYGRAAIGYGRALELFTNQIKRVDASISSIKEGRFLSELIREESREDETWVISLRNLPDAPETYYLMELMASHDFQTALQNYLDLEELRSKLNTWKTSLDAFED